MAKLSKTTVDMANGGMFKKLVRDLFGYSDSKIDDMLAKGVDPKQVKPKRPRSKYLGPNPRAKDVIDNDKFWSRYAADHPGMLKGEGADRMIKGSDGKWHSLDEIDMAHMPNDAVSYWNNYGRFLDRPNGEVPGEISDWMGNLDNYEPQWRGQNRSEGASLSGSGVRYQPPVNLRQGGFTPEQVTQLLDEMRRQYTVTR